MINEEKAREIVEYYTDVNDIGVALNSAKEMAEWKDHQFKEYLEKKLESIRDCYQESKIEYKRDYYFTQMIAIVEIINELFEKTEQDNSDREKMGKDIVV